MKKDILKALVAFSFICIAVILASYVYDTKQKYKDESKKINSNQVSEVHVNKNNKNGFNLPLIIINTNGSVISYDKQVQAEIKVYDNKTDLNYLTDEPKLDSKINIKVRGNTTRYYPKKQYGIELINNDGSEKKEKLLDMKKESKWVLNGPFADKSLMRNYIVFKTSRNIVEYAPDVRFCEIFVIDDNSNNLTQKHYKGVYMLVEKIKRGEDRVDIVKSQDDIDETSFIIAKDRNKPGDITIKSYGKETYIYDYRINIEYPKKDLTPEKYKYVSKYISQFERALYSEKFNDPLTGYNKFIDVGSFVDYYIINEFFLNTDAGILSTYMYKDYNEKMKAGPIWDFNRSLGNNETKNKKAFEYKGFFMIKRSWFDRLMEDVNFANKVVERYKELRKTYLSDEYLLNLIEKTTIYLGDAIDRNFKTWPIYMTNQADMLKNHGDLFKPYEHDPKKFDDFLKDNQTLLNSTIGKANSYEEEIYLMKNFIVERGRWMDENIDSLNKWAN
ncbi:MAG: CotH kinase family protein [Romboutsia sp.]